MTNEEYDELFNPSKWKEHISNDIYDELFNPPVPKEPSVEDISKTRSVDAALLGLRQDLMIEID